MKREIKVTAYELNYDDIPEKPSEFFAFWKEKIQLVPEEYREVALIEIEAEEDYGSAMLAATVSYYRPETNQEEALREGREKTRVELNKQQELRQLEMLKKKYG